MENLFRVPSSIIWVSNKIYTICLKSITYTIFNLSLCSKLKISRGEFILARGTEGFLHNSPSNRQALGSEQFFKVTSTIWFLGELRIDIPQAKENHKSLVCSAMEFGLHSIGRRKSVKDVWIEMTHPYVLSGNTRHSGKCNK